MKPKANVTVLRSRFRERIQAGDESVTQYVAILRNLATECKFAAKDEAIKDQLLSGIRDKDIKITLFRIPTLTLQTAVETATAIEEAQRAADKFKVEAKGNNNNSNEKGEAEIDRLQKHDRNRGGQRVKARNARTERHRQQRSPTRDNQHRDPQTKYNQQRRSPMPRPSRGFATGPRCFCCERPGHVKDDCWHRERTCNGCGRRGHLQVICKQTQRDRKPVKNMQRRREVRASPRRSRSGMQIFFRLGRERTDVTQSG